ncbi:hypothetical protein ES705_20571 [subsurface metagenome]
MMLLTKEIRSKMPPMGSTDGKLDAEVVVKFFSPYSGWTWWAFEGESIKNEEGEEIDFHFYGLVKGFETELGTWSLSEMEGAKRGALPLVERDMYYSPETKEELFKRVYPMMLEGVK